MEKCRIKVQVYVGFLFRNFFIIFLGFVYVFKGVYIILLYLKVCGLLIFRFFGVFVYFGEQVMLIIVILQLYLNLGILRVLFDLLLRIVIRLGIFVISCIDFLLDEVCLVKMFLFLKGILSVLFMVIVFICFVVFVLLLLLLLNVVMCIVLYEWFLKRCFLILMIFFWNKILVVLFFLVLLMMDLVIVESELVV